MFLNRLADHFRKQEWFVVVVELLVVVVGLLMAFQLDRWWEDLGEKQLEDVYLQRLIDDIESDIPQLENAIELAQMRKDYAELLMAVADDPGVAAEQPMSFLVAVDQAAFTYTPTLRKATFEDLRSTGNMRLIRNQELKNKLHEYHSYDESQSQYRPLEFAEEFHWFDLSNGIRNNDQVRLIQDRWLLVKPEEVEEVRSADPGDPGEVLAAAERLRNRPDAISWLSRLRGMQMEQLRVHNIRIDMAGEVLDALYQASSQTRPMAPRAEAGNALTGASMNSGPSGAPGPRILPGGSRSRNATCPITKTAW